MDELLARDDLWILAAFEGETVLGGLTAHVLPMTRSETRELFICDLAVDERVQRRGVGRASIAELRRLGELAGIETAFVPAEDEDTHALAFYRAVGGTPSAVTFFTFPSVISAVSRWPETFACARPAATLEGAAMTFSAAETRAFHEHGFVVKRALFEQDEVREARSSLERLYATAQTLSATGDHDGAFFALARSPEGRVIVQRVVWAGGSEPSLLRLSEDPRLVEPALRLLGTASCEQLLCQAHYKMPNDGVAFDWHQDIQHRDKGGGTWKDVNGRGSFVQSILLVDDMTEENGPLEFVPFDAVQVDAARRLVKGSVDASKAIAVTGRAGDVLFFGPYAVHGSLPNVSDKPRRVLINGYAAPGANARVYPGRGAGRVLPAPIVLRAAG